MNVEEIMIRLGVDARAVSTGLNQTSSYIKGWGASLAHELTGTFGRIFAAGIGIAGFKAIEEKILGVKRASDELGVSTNFVQGLFRKVARGGLGYDSLSRPLLSFKATLDAAKLGSLDAREKLEFWGITAKNTNYHALQLDSGLAKLSDRYLALGKNVAMLKNLGVRATPAMLLMLEHGGDEIMAMNQGSFFTKFSPSAISVGSEFKKQMVLGGNVASSTIANTVGGLFHILRHVQGTIGYAPEAVRRSLDSGGREKISTLLQNENKYISDNEKKEQHLLEIDKEKAAYASAELEAEKEGYTIEEKRTELLAQQRDLTESISRLQASMDDRGKSSIEKLADRAAKLMGVSKVPRGLDSVYTLTPAMMAAFNVRTLEDQATVAGAFGDDKSRLSLIGEADQLRKTNLFSRGDQDPTRDVVLHLRDANEKLQQINSNVDRLPQRTP